MVIFAKTNNLAQIIHTIYVLIMPVPVEAENVNGSQTNRSVKIKHARMEHSQMTLIVISLLQDVKQME